VSQHFFREENGERRVSFSLNEPCDEFFIRGAFAKMTKATTDENYFRIWAQWVLSESGLPAPEDCGERSWTRVDGRSRMTATYSDTPENRLLRVFERFDPDSPEAWAAQIEWRSLTGSGAAVIQRFLGFVRLLDVLPDANTGRRVREGGRKGGTNPKLKRTTTADLVKDWRAVLAKRESPAGGPSAEARWIARHCPTAKGLSEETIRRYLGRFRKLGQKGA
jgi:hypothetical protein